MKMIVKPYHAGFALAVLAVFAVAGCESDLLFLLDSELPNTQDSSNDQDESILDELEEPVAQWTFQDASDSIVEDSSINGLHGRIHGATRVVDDGHAALKFDGENDFVELSSIDEDNLAHLSELGQGSISIWFKLGSLPVGKQIYPIFYYGSQSACDFFDAANKGMIVEVGHHPVQSNSLRLYFTMWANGCTYPSFCFDSNFPMQADKWYHFAAVVGENYNTGYLDGEEMTQRRYNFGSSSESQFFENAVAHEALWLGRGYWDSEVNFFHGLMGDIRIYPEPLSAVQVEALYQTTKTQQP